MKEGQIIEKNLSTKKEFDIAEAQQLQYHVTNLERKYDEM